MTTSPPRTCAIISVVFCQLPSTRNDLLILEPSRPTYNLILRLSTIEQVRHLSMLLLTLVTTA
jgi:hypothetical protein